MKRYKKWVTAGVALTIIGVLAGCGTGGGESSGSIPASNATNTVSNTPKNTSAVAPSNSSTTDSTSGNVPAGNSLATNSTQPNPTTVPTNTTLKVYNSVIANGHYVSGTDLKAQGSTLVYSSYINYMKSQYKRGPSDSLFYEEAVVPYIGTNKKVYYIVNVTEKVFSNAQQKFLIAGSEFLFNNMKFKSINALHQYFISVGGSNTDWNKVLLYLKH